MEEENILDLLEGEKVEKTLRPHVLAFYNLFVIWAIIIGISVLFILYADELSDIFRHPMGGVVGLLLPFSGQMDSSIASMIPLLSDMNAIMGMFFGSMIYTISSQEYLPVLLWTVMIVGVGFGISIFRISWRWIFIMIFVSLISVGITLGLGLPGEATYYIAIVLSIVGIIGVELFRRSHRFYVTNFRIITQLKFIGYKENALSYDKINNIVIEQPLVGRIFNFGTLIPITASGLGMGDDFTAVTLGAAGKKGEGHIIGGAITGGRSINVPRTRSSYALFGVAHPKEIYNIVSGYIQEYVEAPYLKEMSKDLKDILKKDKL